eukprot:m.325935 g.325935  ORF g.325935 m.325935 type:complete len:359 (+) comp27658_c2_seq4:3116-4192(+)
MLKPSTHHRRRTRSESHPDCEAESTELETISLVDKYAIQAMRRLATDGVYSIKDGDEIPIVFLPPTTPVSKTRRSTTSAAAKTDSTRPAVVCPNVTSIDSPMDGAVRFELPTDEYLKCDRWQRAAVLPDYDLDSEDEEWLEDYNASKKPTRATLLPHALELSMAFVLAGRAHDLDEFDGLSRHVHAIARHTKCRLESGGRSALLPSTLTPLSPSDAFDDSDEEPYECFVPYTLDTEPMSAPSGSPVAAAVTPNYRALHARAPLSTMQRDGVCRRSSKSTRDRDAMSTRRKRYPRLSVATKAAGCPSTPPSKNRSTANDRTTRLRVRRRAKRFSSSPPARLMTKKRVSGRAPLSRITNY